MPYKVEYRPLKRGTRHWAIVRTDTGRIVGRSETQKNAKASIRARNAYHRG